jgi:hypothetical protein
LIFVENVENGTLNLWKIIYCPNHGLLFQVDSRCILYTYSSTEFQLVIVTQEEILIGISQMQTDIHPFFPCWEISKKKFLKKTFICFAQFLKSFMSESFNCIVISLHLVIALQFFLWHSFFPFPYHVTSNIRINCHFVYVYVTFIWQAF